MEEHQRQQRAADILASIDFLLTSHNHLELVLAEALLIEKLLPSKDSHQEAEVRVLPIFS